MTVRESDPLLSTPKSASHRELKQHTAHPPLRPYCYTTFASIAARRSYRDRDADPCCQTGAHPKTGAGGEADREGPRPLASTRPVSHLSIRLANPSRPWRPSPRRDQLPPRRPSRNRLRPLFIPPQSTAQLRQLQPPPPTTPQTLGQHLQRRQNPPSRLLRMASTLEPGRDRGYQMRARTRSPRSTGTARGGQRLTGHL